MAFLFLTAVSIASLSYWLGGWEWFLVATASMLCIVALVKEPLQLAAASLIGILWILAFVMTDDRRLFFPYTIQFAVQVLAFWSSRSKSLGLLGSAGVVGLFCVIRLNQSATLIVLLVELVVAGIAVWIASAYYRGGAISPSRRLVAAAIGSVIAFAGLVF